MFGNDMFYQSDRHRQSRVRRFDPRPQFHLRVILVAHPPARMVKLVDTRDLKSLGTLKGHAGSTPAPGTISCTDIIQNGTHLLAPECARQAGAQAVGIRTRARQERPYAARRYAAHRYVRRAVRGEGSNLAGKRAGRT